MDNKKLFIGNISFNTEFPKLLEKFGEFGEIVDSYKPEGKGFAFVTYSEEESAQKAIDAMNGVEFDGRELVVNIARPKGDGGGRRFGGNRGGNRGGGRRFDNNRGGNRGGSSW